MRVRQLLRANVADVVVSYAVDCLSRNQNQIGVIFDEIQQSGARLEFVTERFEDTSVGRFILAARVFIAEVEREKIVERTTRGKLQRARSGKLPRRMGAAVTATRTTRPPGSVRSSRTRRRSSAVCSAGSPRPAAFQLSPMS